MERRGEWSGLRGGVEWRIEWSRVEQVSQLSEVRRGEARQGEMCE